MSNPEEVPDLIHDKELDIWWLMSPNHSEDPTELTETSRIEWPYGVELIDMCGVSDNKYDADGCSACHGLCPEVNKLARLLPKEEKKEPFVKALDDIQKIENLSVNNSAHSFTESAYKTVSSNTQTCGKFEIKSHYDFEPVESSEPAESAYKEFEEAAIKQGHVIESPEPQEKMSYWQYQQFAEAAITQLKDRNEKLESENKALREENTKCKELSWEAANEILRLKKEIDRLKAEALKEKFPEN